MKLSTSKQHKYEFKVLNTLKSTNQQIRNSTFSINYSVKKKTYQENLDKSHLVPGVGIEPTHLSTRV